MRKLTFDDIRVGSYNNVIAAPLWAYQRDDCGINRPIAAVWADVWAELDRREEQEPPRRVHWPRRRGLSRCDAVRTCTICDKAFMGLNYPRNVTCSDRCHKAWRKQNHVQSKQPRPHVSHDPKACPQCGQPFTPKRSDARFCSVRCRVAHHRRSSYAMPIRVQQFRGTELPPNTKSVARPTKWGNPFKVVDGNNEEAVRRFREWITAPEQFELLEQARRELRGFNLACYCELDEPCHADVWLELVNGW
jgi:hypothetical protein